MPFSFFKKHSRTPKLEFHRRIQSYCDFVSHCSSRKSDGSLLTSFSSDTIRLIIFKDQYGDGDDRNHDQRVIFDSKCVSVEKGSGHQKMSRNQSDHRALLDLVFGNVELAFRGDCLRIHCTTDPLQLYLSTVFTPTRARSRESSLSRQNSTSSLASMVVSADDSLCLGNATTSIPMHLVAQYALDNQIVRDATPNTSGMSTSVGTNWLSSLESVRPANGLSGSRSSGNIHQAVSATLPAGFPARAGSQGRTSDLLGPGRDSKPVSQSDSMTSLVSACGRSRRPTRLALCVLMSPFPVEEQAAASKFLADFFANAALWEFLFFALCREVTDLLLTSRHPPVSEVWELLTRFRRGASQVTSGPRLPCPAWLALVTVRAIRRELVRRFAGDCLRNALLLLNTKNTAFFLSTLLTSVLTHHASWVRCVRKQPNSSKTASRCRCKFGRPCTPTRQVHDLYGCLCCGLARVIVTGRDRLMVLVLLHVISYFVRSGHVRATAVEADEEGPPDNVLSAPSTAVPGEKSPTAGAPETSTDPTKSSPLTDSGLSSQEDLAPDPAGKLGAQAAGPRGEAMGDRFCEQTDNGVLLHLPVTERQYEPLPPVNVADISHSLLGEVVSSYSSTLAVQGLIPSSSSATASAGWEEDLRRDLRHAVAWSGAPYAVAVLADLDAHTVREVRVEEEFGPEDEPLETASGPARCVLNMLDTAQGFLAPETSSAWTADACLSSIEHALSQMVDRARTLWQVYQTNDRVTPAEIKRLGIETSDLALYQSIALADICSQG